MGVICIGRNTRAVGRLQAVVKYTFDLAVRNVSMFRGQIASIFFTGVHMFKPQYFQKLIEIAIISHYSFGVTS